MGPTLFLRRQKATSFGTLLWEKREASEKKIRDQRAMDPSPRLPQCLSFRLAELPMQKPHCSFRHRYLILAHLSFRRWSPIWGFRG